MQLCSACIFKLPFREQSQMEKPWEGHWKYRPDTEPIFLIFAGEVIKRVVSLFLSHFGIGNKFFALCRHFRPLLTN